MPSLDVRVVAPDPDVTFAFAPQLAVALWRRDVTLPRLQVFERELEKFIPAQGPQGYATITVIEPTLSLRLPDDARALADRMQREHAPHIRCLSYVVSERGFVAAAARTVASGFLLATRASYPLKIHASDDESALWVSGFVGPREHEIRRVLQMARTA